MRWIPAVWLAVELIASDYTDSIQKWRQDREARLKAPDGWLSLTGLTWLKPGDNPVPGGVMTLKNDQVTFRPAGSSKANPIRPDTRRLRVRERAEALRHSSRSAIRRPHQRQQQRISQRVHQARLVPGGSDLAHNREVHPVPATPKKLFDSQTGDKQEMIIPGVVEFTRAGKTFRVSPDPRGGPVLLCVPRYDCRKDHVSRRPFPVRQSCKQGWTRGTRLQQGIQSALRVYSVRDVPAAAP